MLKEKLALVGGTFCVCACSYNAPVDISPSYNVYSNYDEKLPLSIALLVDAEKMLEDVKVSGFTCSAHSYPVDARASFSSSVRRTFENLVNSVDVVDNPLTTASLSARNLDAMVKVEVSDLDVDLITIPGFFGGQMEADAEISARIVADTRNGRVLGSSVEGSEDARVDAGMACDGGAQAVGKAVEAAIKETVERLGERLANSTKLRDFAKDH